MWKRKRLLALVGLFIMFSLYLLRVIGDETAIRKAKDGWNWLQRPEKAGKIDWLSRRERVVDAFKLSWDAYERYAWGMLNFENFDTIFHHYSTYSDLPKPIASQS